MFTQQPGGLSGLRYISTAAPICIATPDGKKILEKTWIHLEDEVFLTGNLCSLKHLVQHVVRGTIGLTLGAGSFGLGWFVSKSVRMWTFDLLLIPIDFFKSIPLLGNKLAAIWNRHLFDQYATVVLPNNEEERTSTVELEATETPQELEQEPEKQPPAIENAEKAYQRILARNKERAKQERSLSTVVPSQLPPHQPQIPSLQLFSEELALSEPKDASEEEPKTPSPPPRKRLVFFESPDSPPDEEEDELRTLKKTDSSQPKLISETRRKELDDLASAIRQNYTAQETTLEILKEEMANISCSQEFHYVIEKLITLFADLPSVQTLLKDEVDGSDILEEEFQLENSEEEKAQILDSPKGIEQLNKPSSPKTTLYEGVSGDEEVDESETPDF